MSNSKEFRKTILAVYLSSIIAGSGTAGLNAILQKLSEAYPQYSRDTIYLISTMPSLAALVTILILGPIVGKKLNVKTTMIIGLILCLVGGVMPAIFYRSYALILFFRIAFGIGLGFISYRLTIILNMCGADTRPKILGTNLVFQHLGGALIQILAGLFGDIHYSAAFYVYLITIVPLLMVFSVNVDKRPDVSTEGEQKQAVKGGIDRRIWVYFFVTILINIAYSIPSLNNSSFVAFRGFGEASVAGTTQACFTVGAACAGLLLDSFVKHTKKYIVTAYSAILLLAVALIMLSNNVILYGLGMFLVGFSTQNTFSIMLMYGRSMTLEPNVPQVQSIISSAGYLGCFMASYVISLIGSIIPGNVLITSLYFTIALASILCIVFFVKDPRPKELQEAK